MSACLRVPLAVLALATWTGCHGETSSPGGGAGGTGGTDGPYPEVVVLSVGDVEGAPALAVDGSGNGVALFVAEAGLWAARLPRGGAAEAAVRVDASGVEPGSMRVALAEGGSGFAFWMAPGGELAGAGYGADAGFAAAETYLPALDRLALASLDVDPEGDAVVGFAYHDATQDLWMLGQSIRDADSDWRPAEDWAIQRVSQSALAIARAEPYLAVVAAWVDHLGRPWASAIDLDRRSGRLTQTSGFPLDLGSAGAAEDLQVGFDATGHAYAVWRRVLEDGERIQAARRRPDQLWEEAVTLGDAAPGHPPVLATARGSPGAAVAFVDEAGALRVARFDGEAWGSDVVRAAAAEVGDVSLALAPGGALHVAFLEGTTLWTADRPADGEGWRAPFHLEDDARAPVLRAGGDAVVLVWVRAAADGTARVVAARRREP